MNNPLFLEIKKRFETNDLVGAEILCLKVYEQDKKNIHAIKNLALAYLLQKKFHPALIMYLEAFKIDNQDSDVCSNLAYLYKEAEDFKISIEYAEFSISSNPDNALPYKLLGEIFLKLRDFNKAKEYLELSLKKSEGKRHLVPFIQELNNRYIETLSALNENDKALDAIKKTIKSFSIVDPDILTYQIRFFPTSTSEEHIDEAEEIFKKFSMTNDDKLLRQAASYASALAHYYQYKNDLSKSEDYFLKMNKIINKVQDFRPLEAQKNIKNIIRSFNNLPSLNLSEDFGKEMIFIVGMPRSGTTLLESIVANPDIVSTGGELGSFKNMIQFEVTTFAKGDDKKIISYLNQYMQKMKFLLKEKKFLIDKLPFNIFLIGFIIKLLPGAKIILMNREPWANAISLFKEIYIDKHFYSTKFFNIAMQTANFNFCRNYWFERFKNHPNILELDYDALVKNNETLTPKIYEFLGINHKLNLETRKKFYSNTSSFSQVKKDIGKTNAPIKMFDGFKEQFFIDIEDQSKYWLNTSI